MDSKLPLFINGAWNPGHGPHFASKDPGTGSIVWEGQSASEQDIDLAIKAAREAAPGWNSLSVKKRFEYIAVFRDILIKSKDLMAESISKECGKPLWDALNEVATMVNKIDISYKAYEERCAEIINTHPAGNSITRHKPHGVIAIFGPFNFPGHLPNGQIVPALIAGNTVVFKPSEQTPGASETMIKLWEQAGLPKGVLNMVQGGKDTGQFLAKNPQIDGLFFVGSYATGKWLSEQFGSHPEKILALEMGGNNPLIITNISDLKAAAYQTILSAYLSAGQRCTCARRLILPKTPKTHEFVQVLVDMIKTIKVGHYTERPEPYMGPVVSAAAAQKILTAQETLKKNGGIPLVELKLLKENTGLLSPGLIDITAIKKKPDEEIFGPLLQLIWVDDLEQAIEEANKTSYGLTAGLFSDSESEYREFFSKIRAGLVNWNAAITGSSSSAPFGGIGHSGNNRPSAFYAADYCAYPVASIESPTLSIPSTPSPGIKL